MMNKTHRISMMTPAMMLALIMLACSLITIRTAYASADNMSNANTPCIITKLGNTISNTGNCMSIDLNHTDDEYYLHLTNSNMIACYVSGASQSDYNATATGNGCINAGINKTNPLNAPAPDNNDSNNDSSTPDANNYDSITEPSYENKTNSNNDKNQVENNADNHVSNDSDSNNADSNNSKSDNKNPASKAKNDKNNQNNVSSNVSIIDISIMITGYYLLSIFN